MLVLFGRMNHRQKRESINADTSVKAMILSIGVNNFLSISTKNESQQMVLPHFGGQVSVSINFF